MTNTCASCPTLDRERGRTICSCRSKATTRSPSSSAKRCCWRKTRRSKIRRLLGNRTEYRLKRHRDIQWKSQFDKAVESFDRNGFLILIDDKQAESLDQEFVLEHGTQISFVKLTMLVGG